ncbi:hypothetical protein ECANGB1_954 [Enterospora canceri]|uniref:GP-PDE domain-containing protein n=1 Tax=Enterospora canceri TaxID=1081671 RepID=A0A1Y1S722_9MICR|nr:hypothetical protein ECANGB1_954 [Enterospora canceri]
MMKNTVVSGRRKVLIGHRGAGSDEYHGFKKQLKENTVSSFNSVIKYQVDAVEFDIHFYPKEDALVVSHDQVAFSSALLTLQDVFDQTNQLIQFIQFNIELKENESFSMDENRRFVEKVLSVASNYTRNCIFSSFDHNLVDLLISSGATAYFIFDSLTDFNNYALKYNKIVFDCKLFDQLKEKLTHFESVFLYGNDTNVSERAFEYFKVVDGLIVDDVDALQSVINT